MRLILALGAAFAATTMMAHAQTAEHTAERSQIVIRQGGAGEMDADNDGWISRAESAAGADRLFAQLDRNHDGRLDEADRRYFEPPPHPASEADGENCTRTESNAGEERRVTVVCRVEREAEAGGDRVETSIQTIVRRHGDSEDDLAAAPAPPIPPMPPHGPMFMMMPAEGSEADLNNDGAISQDEFRAQHLRMFDARDANGDGRVRAHRPPEPPAPPIPPAPPPSPRRG